MAVTSTLAPSTMTLALRFGNSPEYNAMFRVPKEIILRIAGSLPLVDLIHFASISRDIYNIIIEDSFILTNVMLDTYGIHFHRRLFSRNEYRWLLAREYGMRWFDHVRVSRTPWPRPSTNKFAHKNGFLVAIEEPAPTIHHLSVVHTIHAPELMDNSRVEPFAWKTVLPTRWPITVAVAPEMDLLVAMCANFDELPAVVDDELTVEDMTIDFIFHRLSTAEPHPSAASPIIRISIPVDSATPLRQLAARISICDDVLFAHVGNAHDPATRIMVAYNWTVGLDSMILLDLPVGIFDMAPLGRKHLAITTDRPSIDIYAIVNSRPTLVLLSSLQMPLLRAQQQPDLFNIFATPLPYAPVPGIPSFWDSARASARGCVSPSMTAKGGIFAVTFNTSGTPLRRESTYNFFHDIAKVLEFVRDVDNLPGMTFITSENANFTQYPPECVIPFNVWGPPTGRVMRSIDAHDFTFGIAGHKVVHHYATTTARVMDVEGSVPVIASSVDQVLVMDFTPGTAPSYDAAQPLDTYSAWNTQGTGDWTYVEGKEERVRLVSSGSVIPAGDHEQRVFAEDVVSTLPYREVVTAPLGQLTYSMMDDSRFWTIRSRPADEAATVEVFSM